MTLWKCIGLMAVCALALPAQITGNSLSCFTNVSVTPTLRGEGYSEHAGDILLVCTGGTPTAVGAPVPTVNITIFLNTSVTSRLYTDQWSEALLIVDEPGSGLTGTSNTQLACADANGLCTVTGTGTGVGTYDGSAGRPNVFPGRVSGNVVTFQGIPIDAPGLGHSRVLRFTNLRVNATALNGGPAAGATPVVASLSVSGPVSLLVANPTPTVGFVQPGLSFSSAGASVGRCATQNPLRAGVLTFAEQFGTAFQTRTVASFVDSDTSPTPVAQNIPGMIYNSESQFYSPSLTAPTGDYGTIGLASAGTRLRAVINNVPTGAAVFVSVNRVDYVAGNPVAPVSGMVARLTQDESTAFAPVASTVTLEGIPVAQIVPVNGTVTAVWEVLRANNNALETANFAVWVLPAAASPDGIATVNGSFAPAPPAFTPSAGGAASATLPIPRFIPDVQFSRNLFSVGACAISLQTPAALPDGTALVPYHQVLAVAGGTSPISFSVTGGALPGGITLSSGGVLDGTPQAGGDFSFTVTVTENGGSQDSRGFTLHVAPAALPTLSILKTHSGNFIQGQAGVTFTITVSNALYATPTSGTVTVTEAPGTGLNLVSMSGTGWTCPANGTTCTRSDSLAGGASWPAITAVANIASDAPGTVGNSAGVSGGGGAAVTAWVFDQATVYPAFTDVNPSDFFANAVTLMRLHSITAGCSVTPAMYCPNDNVTRAQMAIFMVRSAMGGDNFTYSPTPYFSDVPVENFAFKWIQKMYEMGITAGCGNGNYCPNDNVTRGQMAIFVIRARLGTAADATFTYPFGAYFTDVPSNHPYFKWIQRMKLDSITAGCGNGSTYCPDDAVTRGQMAIFIVRGAFNQLLPAGTPVIVSVSPGLITAGQAALVTVTGANTHFVQGTTQVSAGPNVVVSNVVVQSPTSLTALVTAANGTYPPCTLLVTTGSEEAVLPNGLVVQ